MILSWLYKCHRFENIYLFSIFKISKKIIIMVFFKKVPGNDQEEVCVWINIFLAEKRWGGEREAVDWIDNGGEGQSVCDRRWRVYCFLARKASSLQGLHCPWNR